MSAIQEIEFGRDEGGKIWASASDKYQVVGQLFEDLAYNKSAWHKALDAVVDPKAEPWGTGGDAYWIQINRDGVTFFNQFSADEERVTVSRREGAALIRAFMKACGYL